MSVPLPTIEQLREISTRTGLSVTDSELTTYIELMRKSIDSYNVLDSLPDNLPSVKYPRTSGYRPSDEENTHNAWYYKTAIKGASEGKLKGKKIAVKDNVMVADVPMMDGSSILEGYVPEIDATIVSRILDAGGEISGKAHCEYFCHSGSSFTNATGPVHNPFKMGFSAGGSSSGSAVLVALGEVDMAIGADQGGSIRIPSSYSGVYGMKPTHGLVPYTGMIPMETYIDHAGPMTANVADNALLLEVIAGRDGYDPRSDHVKTHRYTDSLGAPVKEMRIGLVKEGFGHDVSEADVDEKVRCAADSFRDLGVFVEEISIPWHLMGVDIWLPITIEAQTQNFISGGSYGYGHSNLYVGSFIDFFRGWPARANELPPTTRFLHFLGSYIHNQYGNRYYGKAMNINRQLIAAYDDALSRYDLLMMPTTPNKAQPLPGADVSVEEYVQSAMGMIQNTAPFNSTHHPAMAIPCGMSDGLPVSLMLIGKHFDEPNIYRAASAFERAADWRTM